MQSTKLAKAVSFKMNDLFVILSVDGTLPLILCRSFVFALQWTEEAEKFNAQTSTDINRPFHKMPATF